jgi:hypothetical protein
MTEIGWNPGPKNPGPKNPMMYIYNFKKKKKKAIILVISLESHESRWIWGNSVVLLGKFLLMSETSHKSRVSRQLERWCSADHTDPFLQSQSTFVCWFFNLRGSHCLNAIVSGSVTHFDSFHRLSTLKAMTRMSVATMLPSTHACQCELSSTLGFTSLPVNYVEWQYCTFLCELSYINIHLSSVVHHRSPFPRTMIDWLLRLWIWLTRFSHRHNLKWWNGTNSHVFLEITDLPSAILFFDGSSQRVIYSPLS